MFVASSHSPKAFRRIGGSNVSVNGGLSLRVSPAMSWRRVRGAWRQLPPRLPRPHQWTCSGMQQWKVDGLMSHAHNVDESWPFRLCQVVIYGLKLVLWLLKGQRSSCLIIWVFNIYLKSLLLSCCLQLTLRPILMTRSSVPKQTGRLGQPDPASPQPSLHQQQQQRKIRSDKCLWGKIVWGFRWQKQSLQAFFLFLSFKQMNIKKTRWKVER